MIQTPAARTVRKLRRALLAATILFGLMIGAALFRRFFAASALGAIAWLLVCAVIARLITQLEPRS